MQPWITTALLLFIMMGDVKLSRNSIFYYKKCEAHTQENDFYQESKCFKDGPSVGLATGLEKKTGIMLGFFGIKRKNNLDSLEDLATFGLN